MSFIKFIYLLLFLLTAAPVLGYVRHLHDEEENRSGAFVVLVFILITAAALWKGSY